jgi:hypothetical protein
MAKVAVTEMNVLSDPPSTPTSSRLGLILDIASTPPMVLKTSLLKALKIDPLPSFYTESLRSTNFAADFAAAGRRPGQNGSQLSISLN